MILRLLSAVLFALAMLLAPLGLGSGAAMPPGAVHGTMSVTSDPGHCDDPAKGADHEPADRNCCAATCGAIALAPAPAIDPVRFARALGRPVAAPSRHGFLAKLPTPPPRG